MAATNWKFPTAAVSGVTGDGSAGSAWVNPTNVGADDATYATRTVGSGAKTRALRASGFGFTSADIPDGSIIRGIEVSIRRYGSTVTDSDVYLVPDGSAGASTDRSGSNKAAATDWGNSASVASYGGAADLWGATISLAQIRASAFAVDLQATAPFSGNAVVDYIAVRVTYDPPPTGSASITEADDTSIAGSAYVAAVDLDFTSGVLDSRISFTRATIATRVNASGFIETVASGVPRFDYNPITLLPRGLLIEEQRTNLAFPSEQFDNTAWVSSAIGASASANVAADPAGGTTADKLVEDTSTGSHRLNFNLTVSAQAYTFSVYAKAAGRRRFSLRYGSVSPTDNATFDLVSGTVVAGTGTIENVGGGWFRCSVTSTSSGAGLRAHSIYLNTDTATGAVESYTGDGSSGVYLWGAQIEAGAFATSYIPTTTAAVTRNADQPIWSGSGFTGVYNPSEGSVVADIEATSLGAGANKAIFAIHDGAGSANFIQSFITPAKAGFAQVRSGGVDSVSFNVAGHITTGVSRSAMAWATNDVALVVNGGTPGTDTSATIPTGMVRMSIGWAEQYSGLSLNGAVRRIRYFNQRLPNALLQTFAKALTGSAALTEANDNVVAGGRVRITGQAVVTEGDDVAAAAGEVGIPLLTPGSRTAAVAASRLSNRIAR